MHKKIHWTDWALIDEDGKIIGESPEYYPGWVLCPTCDEPMPYYGNGHIDDYFECQSCGYKISGSDAMSGDWDKRRKYDNMPPCCEACGGPWPSCESSCKMFDD